MRLLCYVPRISSRWRIFCAIRRPVKTTNMSRCNSCETPISRPRACCPPARIPVRPLLSAKKANASGLVEVMKRRWLAAYITPISKITCAIRKTRRWICTKRSIPVLTCQRRSISTASMAMNINSSVSLKAADRRIKPTSIRRQKRF